MPTEPVREVDKTSGAKDHRPPGNSDGPRLGASQAQRRAEGGEPPEEGDDNTVAILDGFDGHLPGTNDIAHGEYVEQVLIDSGVPKEDIERYSTTPSIKKPESLDNGGLDRFIEDNFVGILDATSDNLQKILQDDDIDVITQSMGTGEIRVAEMLSGLSKQDPQFRADLARELGLPADCSQAEFTQAVVDRVDRVHEESERVKASQERYDGLSAEVDDRGIVYTVAAGNHGKFAQDMQEMGVEADQDFYDNVLANEHTTVVGASDGNGSPAELTTPNAGAEVAMDGTDIAATVDGEQISKSGTSFSTPQVAALASQMLKINPDLSDEQVEAMLEASGKGGNENTLGAGQIDPAFAQMLALLGQAA